MDGYGEGVHATLVAMQGQLDRIERWTENHTDDHKNHDQEHKALANDNSGRQVAYEGRISKLESSINVRTIIGGGILSLGGLAEGIRILLGGVPK